MTDFRVVEGWEPGRVLPLTRRSFGIGRSDQDYLRIPDSSVSRGHAEMTQLRDRTWTIVDCGSTNGVLVNDERLVPNEPRRLRHGDLVRLGKNLLELVDPVAKSGAFPLGAALSDERRRGLISVELEGHEFLVQRALELAGAGAEGRSRLQECARLVRAAAQDVAAALDLDLVLLRLQELVQRAIGPDLCVVFLLDAAGTECSPRAFRERAGARSVADLAEGRVARTLVDHAITERVGVLAPAPGSLDGELLLGLGVRSALCAPLVCGERVLGALYAHSEATSASLTRESLLLACAVCELTATALSNATLYECVKEDSRRRNNLERYFSPTVLEFIDEGHDTSLGLREMEVSILFGDLEGSTSMAEKLPPSGLARLLDGYYDAVTEVVFANEGTVNEFIGDSVMAVFGAPKRCANHAQQAVRAGLQILERLRARRRTLASDVALYSARVAINSGRVVAGSVGPPTRMKYAVIGDAVHVAARLEKQGKPGTVVIGERTFALLQSAGDVLETRDLGAVAVRGREQHVRAYEVLRFAPASEGMADEGTCQIAPPEA